MWLWGSKDGGPESNTRMWGLELKNWFSVLVLKFEGRSERKVFHNHAFSSLSFLLVGSLHEVRCTKGHFNIYDHHFYDIPGSPIWIYKDTLHEVHDTREPSYVLSFRGKWRNEWNEYNPYTKEIITLTHGRKVLEKKQNNTVG